MTEASLERLVGLAEDMGSDDLNDIEDCDDEDVDEVLTDWGEVAAGINNGGLESQLKFLLMGNSELQVALLLHQAVSQ